MKQHGRIDANQRAIVKLLRQWPGATVHSTADLGGGFPDLILGYRQQTLILEVKTPKGKLTPQQEDWHSGWTGSPVVILRSEDDAIALMQKLDADYRHMEKL